MQIKACTSSQSYLHNSMDNNYKHRNYIGLIFKSLKVIKSAGNRQANLAPLCITRSSCFHTSIPVLKQMAVLLCTWVSWCTDSAYCMKASHGCVPCRLTPFQDPLLSLGDNRMTMPEPVPFFHHQWCRVTQYHHSGTEKKEQCTRLRVPLPASTKQQPDLRCHFCSSTLHGTQFYHWPTRAGPSPAPTRIRAAGSLGPPYLIP